MKYFTVIICTLMLVLMVFACLLKYKNYRSVLLNESSAKEYLKSNYNIECETVSKWAGHSDNILGRQQDIFIMKEKSTNGFPFRMEVYTDKIDDYYPYSYMGNAISKRLCSYITSTFPNEINKLKCNSIVYTSEKVITNSLAEINELQDGDIRISVFLVTDKGLETCQEVLCSAFDFIQNSFDTFNFSLYCLTDSDYDIIFEYFNTHERLVNGFGSIGINPKATFEYSKSASAKRLNHLEITGMLEVLED